MRPPTYDPEAVRPMWEELVRVGMTSLTTAEEVEEYITKKSGTTLVLINSVCGCAAGNARPGAMLALQNDKIPDNLTTVFAGLDHEAVEKARSYMSVPPSSPAFGLFKDGKMIYSLERHQIEQMGAQDIANALVATFNEHCTATGPSISTEELAKIVPISQCGSKVPKFEG